MNAALRQLRHLLALLASFMSSFAAAGVDQGNPSKASFNNMAKKYMIHVNSPWTVRVQGSASTVRVDLRLPLALRGYFLISDRLPQLQNNWRICQSRYRENSRVTLYWVGSDCNDMEIREQFLKFQESVIFVNYGG